MTEQHDAHHHQYYYYHPKADDYYDCYRSNSSSVIGEVGGTATTKEDEQGQTTSKTIDEPLHQLQPYYYSPSSVVVQTEPYTHRSSNYKAKGDISSSSTYCIPRFVFSENDEEKKDDEDDFVSYPTKCISDVSSTAESSSYYRFGETSLLAPLNTIKKKKNTNTNSSSLDNRRNAGKGYYTYHHYSKTLPVKKREFYNNVQQNNNNDDDDYVATRTSTTMKMMTGFEQSAIGILSSIRAYEKSKQGQKRSLYTTATTRDSSNISSTLSNNKGAEKAYDESNYSSSSSPKKKQRLVWEQEEVTKPIKSSSSIQSRNINSTTKKNKRRPRSEHPRGESTSKQAVTVAEVNYDIETNVLMSLLEEKQDEHIKEEEERNVLLLCQKITEIEQQNKSNENCYNPMCEDVVHCICGSTLLTDRAHRRAMRQHQHLLLHTSSSTT